MLTSVSIFYGLFLFVFGLFIGSFLNVLIDRIPRGEKISGRSHCENCKKTLQWHDLIPVLSFVYLKGKCRYCRAKLSPFYPVIEIITGILFVLTYYAIYNSQFSISNEFLNLGFYLLIVSSLIVIFFADLKYGIIPDKIVIPTTILTFVWLLFNNHLILNHLLSAFGAFLFFLFIYLITKEKGMGFGDVKLSFLMGLILGFPGIMLALYIAFLTGGGAGIILVLWKKKSLSLAVPFGPFLVIGTLLSLFFQDEILSKLLPFII